MSTHRRSELPIDVAEDILVQLRVKDIVRCKVVCRSWFDLIGSQRFINKHLLHHSPSKNKIIITTKYCGRSVAVSFSPPRRPLQFYVPPRRLSTEIVGSCNGVLCLVLEPSCKLVCLWNPSTREHRMSPCIPDSDHVSVFALGFGYDVRTGDYKVVKIISSKKRYFYGFLYNSDEYFVEVWSTRTRGWRKINSPVLCKLFMHTPGKYAIRHQAGIFVRGKLYWVVHRNDRVWDAALISFDMGDDTFCSVKILPDTIASQVQNYNCGILVDFMGSLAMPICARTGVYSIWVLGDDDTTWTHQFTIGPFRSRLAHPEGVCIDGMFLMRAKNKYFLYNPITEEEKELPGVEAPGWSYSGIGRAGWSFTESLVLLSSEV